MSSRILITGAGGFVGRKIVKNLLQQNFQILAIDKYLPDFGNSNVTCSNADLIDKEQLRQDIGKFKPTAVLHLAAIASPTYGNVAELYNVNVCGSEYLLDILQEVCEKNTRVVLISTAGVYGNSNKDYITEDTEYNPQNHYSFSKMIMEYISKRYTEHLDIKIIRPFNMIGTGQNENFLIPKLVKAFVTKQSVLSVGNMNTYRDFVDIDFAVQILCKALLSKDTPRVMNICNGHGVCGNDVIKMLTDLTKYSPKIEVNQEFLRKNEIMRLVGDPTKCNQFMGDSIRSKSVKEILSDMVTQFEPNVSK